MDAAAIDALARRLLNGRAPRLDAAELDAVLSWLSGGQRHGAAQLSRTLGNPHSCPRQVAALYQLLDVQLLHGGRLDPGAAHVAGSPTDGEKKARYRRLIQAFHPDRYPELAAWLTPRSQLVNQAYAAFKRGEAPPRLSAVPGPAPTAVSPGGRSHASLQRQSVTRPDAVHPWQPGPHRRSARLVPARTGTFQRLFGALAKSPGRARLMIGALAIVALVPLLMLHVADRREPYQPSPLESGAATMAAASRTASQALTEQTLPDQPASVRVVEAASSTVDSARQTQADGFSAAHQAYNAPVADAAGRSAEPEIEALFQRIGRHVSSGDLEALQRLVVSANPNAHSDSAVGIDWIGNHFDRIISGSRRRHQEFQILSIEHQPPYWSVLTLSRLTMAFDDLTARHEEARYRFTIRRDEDGQLRITGLDG